MLLEAGGDNFIACLDGDDAGIIVSLPYQEYFTWIAMVLVDPNARRMGVGKTLMNKVIELAQPRGAIRLDATAEGYELYKKLGFQTEYELVRFIKSPTGSGVRKNKHTIQPGIQMSGEVLSSVMQLDLPIFGADRSGILRNMYKRNPEYAFCRNENASLKGYCMGRSGSQYEHIGPIIAEGSAYATDLLAAVLDPMETKDIVIDVFADKTEWISHLKEFGFTEQRSFTRMCLGQLPHQGLPEKQFAIAGPEIG
jgi:N-acetylglutamate synthase-like GNAT family acetyltransferase